MIKSNVSVASCLVFLTLTASNLVCREVNAQFKELPLDVVEALQKYSKLDTVNWSWKGNRSYLIAGKKATYSTMGSYKRSEKKFAWNMQLTEGRKSILDRSVRFDGATLASANGKDQMTWYAIEKISKSQPSEFSISIPYFDAVGLHYPKDNGSLAAGPFKSQILYLLENGADLVRCVEEKIGDKHVLVVELDANHEALVSGKTNAPERDRLVYYLSKAEGFGVIKHQRKTISGKTCFESSVKSLSSSSADLPVLGKDVTVKSYINLGEPEFQVMTDPQETTLLTAESPRLLSTTDDDFVLKKESAKAGAQLIDGVTPELQNPDGSISVFNMPASPDDLEKAIAAASVKRSYRSTMIWIIGLTVLIGGGLAAYFQYRKSH